VAAFLLAFQALVLPLCAASLLGIDHALGFDLATLSTEPAGLAFFLRPPVLPWILGALGLLSLVGAYLCVSRRGLPMIFGIAASWLALLVVAVAAGNSPTLLFWPALTIALLWVGRSWFDSPSEGRGQ
jgi:hypothetical protein